MTIIRGLYNLGPQHQASVVTLGNFDGMHLGHQKLLSKVKKKATELNTQALVITFEPQPNEFFSKKNIAPRLMRFREKYQSVIDQGLDQVLCIHFNDAFASLTAENFITQVLVAKLAIKHVVVGDDFRFGYKRRGDITLLQEMGAELGFTAECMSPVLFNGERVSSTRVRTSLAVGDFTLTEKMLGKPFGMSGKVAHGDKRGRILGFPTANIYLHRHEVPLGGIYVVQVQGLPESPITGVASIGTRPTVGGTEVLLEVHCFDFDREIYGEHVQVEFFKKLRDEEKFDNLELLQQQMVKDAELAKAYFQTWAA